MTSPFAADRPYFYTVPKVEDQVNEDSWAWSHKGIIALSDGASISFDSAAWARILVRSYCRSPNFSEDWLKQAITDFSRLHNREELPWMKQAAFDRGSFASLIGVHLHDGGKLVQVFAVGDSLAVLCEGDQIKATFPYQKAAEFDRSPQLLSTNPTENVFLRDWDSKDNFSCDWTVHGRHIPALLFMTDALGQWLLSMTEAGESPVEMLRGLRTRSAFTSFVRAERKLGRLRTDDTTLVAYW
jgi:hypothetical protein